MRIANILTKQIVDEYPKRISSSVGMVDDPTPEQCAELGWYEIVEELLAPEGMVCTEYFYEVIKKEEKYTDTETVVKEVVIDGIVNNVTTYEEVEKTRMVDTTTCREVCVSWYDPVKKAAEDKAAAEAKEAADKIAMDAAIAAARAAKVATLTAAIIEGAQMYRALIQKHFGAKAETNPLITRSAVGQYFLKIQDIPLETLADSQKLEELYNQLLAWWGGQRMQDFCWEAIP
jgi:hypothetical protein